MGEPMPASTAFTPKSYAGQLEYEQERRRNAETEVSSLRTRLDEARRHIEQLLWLMGGNERRDEEFSPIRSAARVYLSGDTPAPTSPKPLACGGCGAESVSMTFAFRQGAWRWLCDRCYGQPNARSGLQE